MVIVVSSTNAPIKQMFGCCTFLHKLINQKWVSSYVPSICKPTGLSQFLSSLLDLICRRKRHHFRCYYATMPNSLVNDTK